jgi:glyoxylase-like metal-dependent hydrolase (beta-lactamase superfamily II)
MGQYLQSLERMKGLDPAVLLPAHGSSIVKPQQKLDEYIAHRLWRESRVLGALRRLGPAPARALVPDAYSDVAPMLHGLAEYSLVAHLIKLAEDGKAARDGDTWRPSEAAVESE